MNSVVRHGFVALLVAGVVAVPALAQAAGPDAKLHRDTVERGVAYLLKAKAADGSYSGQAGSGVTALATLAILRSGRGPDDPAVADSLAYLAKFAADDGGIHAPRSRIPNYETCLAVQCLKEANKDGRYDKLLVSAEKYIRGAQIDEADQKEPADLEYGGAGYGAEGRPDLSNTAFVVDTLHELGAGGDDEAIQKALIFVSRCQNLESEHNTTKFAAGTEDGGFIYTVAAGGNSPAGENTEGALRSYGAMTYSGLKSLIYAGLAPEDERVQAATKWLRNNYTLEQNPGIGDAGLYYYYHTFAKCLDALGQDTFADDEGVEHDWRKELTEELAQRQSEDGSWVNENRRWMENDPNLVTAFAVLALSYCEPRE